MKKTERSKNLSLKTETVRDLSAAEIATLNGGLKHWYCWTFVIPSSGLTTTIAVSGTEC